MSFNFQRQQSRRISNSLFIIVLIFLCYSCNSEVKNTYTIDNETETGLIIKAKLKENFRDKSDKDSIKITLINAGETAQILSYEETGNTNDKKDSFLEGVDTIIVLKRNYQLHKNLLDRNNWDYKVLTNTSSKMNEVEYKLPLTEKDFK